MEGGKPACDRVESRPENLGDLLDCLGVNALALYSQRLLAEHYNLLVMAPDLIRAHDERDQKVDKAFGAPRKLTTERQRQELLFVSYAELTKKKGDEG